MYSVHKLLIYMNGSCPVYWTFRLVCTMRLIAAFQLPTILRPGPCVRACAYSPSCFTSRPVDLSPLAPPPRCALLLCSGRPPLVRTTGPHRALVDSADQPTARRQTDERRAAPGRKAGQGRRHDRKTTTTRTSSR
jgi:hypothetical protein